MAVASLACQSQRSLGYDVLRVELGPVTGDLVASGSSVTWKWIDANGVPGTYATLAVPWDVAGDIVKVAVDKVLVSGRSSASGDGFVARLELVAGAGSSLGAIVLVDFIVLPGVDPYEMHVSAPDAMLYIFDAWGRKVYGAPWFGWSPVVSPLMILDTNGLNPSPVSMRGGRLPGESPSGVYLETGELQLMRGMHAKYYLSGDGGVWTLVDQTEAVGSPTEVGITVRDAHAAPWQGPIALRMISGGNASVVRATDGVVVATALTTATSEWQSLLLPAPLDVGHGYRVTASGYSPSAVFYPSFRLGLPWELPTLGMRRGEFYQSMLRVGSSRFAVRGNIDWLGGGAPQSEVVPYFLAIAAVEPGAESVVLLPNGQAMLAQFEAVLVGEYWIRPQPPPDTVRLRVEFPIPGDPELDGLPLLFQWAAFDGGGELLVSDVFGGRVLAAQSAAAGSPQGGVSAGSSAPARSAVAAAWLGTCNDVEARKRLRKAWRKKLGN
jgi:hypothetical protein